MLHNNMAELARAKARFLQNKKAILYLQVWSRRHYHSRYRRMMR